MSFRAEQGFHQELANRWTHIIGLGFAVLAVTTLIFVAGLKGSVWHIVSCSIYGATLLILYLSSVLYHSASPGPVKRIFRVFDHASIYLLIAGTYTPFMLVNLRGGWGWSLFGAIWGLAIFGIILKVFRTGRAPIFSTLTYLMMGWLVVIAIKPLAAVLLPGGFVWLIAGGVFYTVGIVFFALSRIPYFHMIWHLFVLGGSICHFFAIYYYVLP